MWSGLFVQEGVHYLYGTPFEAEGGDAWVGRASIEPLQVEGCVGMCPPSDPSSMVLHADGRWWGVLVKWAPWREAADPDHLERVPVDPDDDEGRIGQARMVEALAAREVPPVCCAAAVGLLSS